MLVAVSATGFASGTILSKPIYAAGVDWLQLLAWRFAVGALLAWGWVAISARRRAAAGRLALRPTVAAAGLGVWFTGNAGTYYAGLETVPASLAAVLVYLYPALVAVLSIRFASQLVGRRPWIALAVAMAGVILALGGIQLAEPPPLSGVLLVLASPIVYAGWIILSSRLAGERRGRLAPEATPGGGEDDAAVMTAVMITATAAVFVGAAVVLGRPIVPSSLSSSVWPLLVANGFGSTFLAIQTFYAGARRIGAAQAALISTIEPLVIVTLAAVVLNDVLAPIQLVGAGLILLGVLIAQTGDRPSGSPQPATPLDGEVRSQAPAEAEPT